MDVEGWIIRREQVKVGGTDLSYLASGDPAAPPLSWRQRTCRGRRRSPSPGTVLVAASLKELLQARMRTMQLTVGRELSDEEIADYTSPWRSPAHCRSWMAIAAAADAKYTPDLVPALRLNLPVL